MRRKGALARSILAVACAVGFWSCAEDNPIDPPEAFAPPEIRTETFGFNLQLNRLEPDNKISRTIVVGCAGDECPPVPTQPFPVLYLLHDHDGDQGYFERYGLQSLLDEMYRNGEIGRMLVVTVDASGFMGGSYYRNSEATGRYEDMLTELIEQTEANRKWNVYKAAGRAARAIGGHGMGGYGALRYALDHPDLFGAVSSMSAPLSFGEPHGSFGIWPDLVDSVITENGGAGADLYSRVRAGADRPLTRMLFAMSGGFSPHPLRRYVPTEDGSIRCCIVCILRINNICRLADTICPCDSFVSLHPGAATVKFPGLDTNGVGVDLIFDPSGEPGEPGSPADSAWALWRDFADVKNVFVRKAETESGFLDAFKQMGVYLDVGDKDEFGYLGQTSDFHATLSQFGVAQYVEYEEYSGFAGVPAGHSQLIAARLRKVIKFHSDQFDRLGGRPPSP